VQVKVLKGATALETHSAILDLIRSSGEVTRIELAARSGLTGASISRIVKQLLAEGLVIETGVGEFTGGKRRTIIQLNASARHAVGVSLDDVGVTYMVTDLAGSVVGRHRTAGIASGSPVGVIKRVVGELGAFLDGSGIERRTLVGIGVAMPGRRDEVHRVRRSDPEATGWELLAVQEALGSASGLPVAVENDSTCAAIGEYWVGRIPASTDFATLYMANGFGLGLVIDGDAYRGASSNVGEIGHLVLDVNGPECECGNRGCLEALAAPRRVVELGLQRPGLGVRLGLVERRDRLRRNFGKITEAAQAGDQDCRELVEQSAFYLAKALVSITNLLDLDRIILAGPAFSSAAEIYLRTAAAELDRYSFIRAVHPTMITLSSAGQDSAALGAAALVLHSRLTPHQTSRQLAVIPEVAR
jgi:predicted NBD/HSP70 family sugar kinase